MHGGTEGTATAAVLPARNDAFAKDASMAHWVLSPIAPAAPPSDQIVVFQAVDIATCLVELLVEATTFIVRDVAVGFGSALIGRDACLLVAKQAIFVPRELARAAGGPRAGPLGRAARPGVVPVVLLVWRGAPGQGGRSWRCR